MKRFNFFVVIILASMRVMGQDTFSIVAVDSITGDIGSAGASCLGYFDPVAPKGAYLISDILPGIGAIHTQAQWDGDNQLSAHSQMKAGLSPKEIIAFMEANDVGDNPEIRQYGVVDLHGGHPRAAAYTGVQDMDYKGHITGGYYSIQGNILLGRQILDSMEARFLRTTGRLEDKLMAALQGANVVGADTRCTPNHSSSHSSFIRVSTPKDSTRYLDLFMSYPYGITTILPVDPVDSLQTLYDHWKTNTGIRESSKSQARITISYDENLQARISIESSLAIEEMSYEVYDITGKRIATGKAEGNAFYPMHGNVQSGIYVFNLIHKGYHIASHKLVAY